MTWQTVELREVLALDLDRVEVRPEITYEMLGVYSFGRGLFRRPAVSGTETSYKFFYRLHPDHVVMSQLFGWEGALALSAPEYAGMYVSPQFPTFRCDSELLDREFLGWLMRRSAFWEELGTRTKGMGDRRRTLNPEALFSSRTPLPPLEEQRRIVAQIEELAAKVEEARGLRQRVQEQLQALVASLHLSLAGERRIRIGDILALDEEREPVVVGHRYPQVGIKGFGQGLFARETLEASETTYKTFNRLYAGALVLSQVKGWEGAIAVCPPDLAGRYASPEYRTFRCKPGEALPAYISALVATPWFYEQLALLTRGVGARRERIRPEQFLEMEIPMPTVDQQRQAIAVFGKAKLAAPLCSETITELDALLPSILDHAFIGKL
jgi:type I restriction enzyme S subunit